MSANRLFTHLKSSKGISLISIIIIAAVIYAGLSAYAYFNPDFQLNKITPIYFLREYRDNQRKDHLEKISQAVEQYKQENGEYPTTNEWCGRVISITHPDLKIEIVSYFENEAIPQDPSFRGTGQDYFYRREDRNNYVLLARLENLPSTSPTFNYEGCHDWPGDDVFNYQVSNAD